MPRLKMLVNIGSAAGPLEDLNLPDEVKTVRWLANIAFHGSTCQNVLQGGATIWLVAFHGRRNRSELFR